MSNIVILNDGMAVYVNAFSEQPTINVLGLVDSFTYSGIKYKYFNIDYYITGQITSNQLVDGYYKEDLFFKYLYYLNNPDTSITYTAETLVKDGYLSTQNFKQNEAVEGDVITINAVDFSKHNFYYEELELKFNIQKDEDGRIKRYANNGEPNFPQTSQDGLISKIIKTTNDASASTTGKFYFKNFGDPQQNWEMPETSKVEFDKVVTLTCFRIFKINQEIFPLITNNLAIVDQLGNGSISNTNPNVTELIKALAEIKKSWGFYQILLPFFDVINPKIEEYSTYYKTLVKFSEEIDRIRYNLSNKTDDEKLILISQLLSGDALKILPLSTRKYLIKKYAYQKNLIDSDEEQVLKLINTINTTNQNEVNDFLGWLIDDKEKKTTGNQLPPYSENIYGLLYRKIDNYPNILKIAEVFGDKSFSKDNKTRFVNAILVLWSESKYNPYKNMINGQPDFSLIDNSTFTYDKTYKHSIIINYISEKKYGLYNDDFVFAFDPWARGIYFIKDIDYKLIASSDYNHIYQPVTLVHYPSENDTAIQLPYKDGEFNGLVPLFFLKYVDDYGDDQDLFTKIGYFLDVVTIPTGIGNLAKLRHLRHFSRLGQLLLIIETINLSKDIIQFLMNFVCNDTNEFCKKVKTILTFLEIFSLLKDPDPIIVAKIKKTATLIIEQALNDGWPSEFSVPINGETPKQKIEELAGINNAQYFENYKTKANNILSAQLSADTKKYANYYSNIQITELFTAAFNKGLSTSDIAGIIHQACRIRNPVYIAPVAELKQRMENLLQVKRQGHPYTFNSKADFQDYIDEKVKPFIEMFGLPKNTIKYGGSSITSPGGFSPGPQDTDWWVFFENKDEERLFIEELVLRYENYKAQGLMKGSKANGKIKRLRERYAERLKEGKEYIDKEYITAVYQGPISEYHGTVVDLRKKEKEQGNGFFEAYFGIDETDVTLKVKGVNEAIPNIKIKLF